MSRISLAIAFFFALLLRVPATSQSLADTLKGQGDVALLQNGNGTEALRLYKLASEKGSEDAELMLGSMYMEGRGVPKDTREGLRWMKKVVDRKGMFADIAKLAIQMQENEAKGQSKEAAAANALRDGLRGSPAPKDSTEALTFMVDGTTAQRAKDYAGALSLYRKSFAKGNFDAAVLIGDLYLSGLGVTKDSAQARDTSHWHRIFRIRSNYRRSDKRQECGFGEKSKCEIDQHSDYRRRHSQPR